jgi:heme/copper-type cytochrome/quinol oxidase subunit 2
MSTPKEHPFRWLGMGLLAATTVITFVQIDLRHEPRWLEQMNNFEHFVFHLTLVMAGLIVGGLGLLLCFALPMRKSRHRRDALARALNEEHPARLRQDYLISIALVALAVVTVILAKRHIIEPLWLTDVTPFQHFLVHLGLVSGGLILGASALGVFAWSLMKLLDTFPRSGARRASDDESRPLFG